MAPLLVRPFGAKAATIFFTKAPCRRVAYRRDGVFCSLLARADSFVEQFAKADNCEPHRIGRANEIISVCLLFGLLTLTIVLSRLPRNALW